MFLRNDFHKTKIRIQPKIGKNGELYFTRHQAQQAWQVLCGMPLCKCCGGAGEQPIIGYWKDEDTYMIPSDLPLI